MSEWIVTSRIEVPRWTEAEIAAVNAKERIAIWRSADWRTEAGPTHVSLRVEASDEHEARRLVQDALRGLMELDIAAFGPSSRASTASQHAAR